MNDTTYVLQPFSSPVDSATTRHGYIVAESVPTLRAEHSSMVERNPSILWGDSFTATADEIPGLTDLDIHLLAAGAAIWLDDTGAGWWAS